MAATTSQRLRTSDDSPAPSAPRTSTSGSDARGNRSTGVSPPPSRPMTHTPAALRERVELHLLQRSAASQHALRRLGARRTRQLPGGDVLHGDTALGREIDDVADRSAIVLARHQQLVHLAPAGDEQLAN